MDGVGHLSLLHGWLPLTVQLLTALALGAAIGWRTRRWRRVWLPVAVAVGVGLTLWARWYLAASGMAGEPAPLALWIWIAATGAAVAVLCVGWRSAQWWRRSVSVLAVPMCLL